MVSGLLKIFDLLPGSTGSVALAPTGFQRLDLERECAGGALDHVDNLDLGQALHGDAIHGNELGGQGKEKDERKRKRRANELGSDTKQGPTWSPTLRSMAAAGDPGLILLMTTYVFVCGRGEGERLAGENVQRTMWQWMAEKQEDEKFGCALMCDM